MCIRQELPEDRGTADAIVERAFGPGRLAKAAERLREGGAPAPGLSFLAWSGATAVGAVRLWRIEIGTKAALLLGPIAVDEQHREKGIGAALVRHACDEAARADYDLILLIGDEPWFGSFGFRPAMGVIMPGPVDRRRVLVRALTNGAADGLAGVARQGSLPMATGALAAAA